MKRNWSPSKLAMLAIVTFVTLTASTSTYAVPVTILNTHLTRDIRGQNSVRFTEGDRLLIFANIDPASGTSARADLIGATNVWAAAKMRVCRSTDWHRENGRYSRLASVEFPINISRWHGSTSI